LSKIEYQDLTGVKLFVGINRRILSVRIIVRIRIKSSQCSVIASFIHCVEDWWEEEEEGTIPVVNCYNTIEK
jgi:hypothetical protein